MHASKSLTNQQKPQWRCSCSASYVLRIRGWTWPNTTAQLTSNSLMCHMGQLGHISRCEVICSLVESEEICFPNAGWETEQLAPTYSMSYFKWHSRSECRLAPREDCADLRIKASFLSRRLTILQQSKVIGPHLQWEFSHQPFPSSQAHDMKIMCNGIRVPLANGPFLHVSLQYLGLY